MPMQPTPLRGPEIVAILKASFVLTAFPIYRSGAADGQALGGLASLAPPSKMLCEPLPNER
jgi:hypothetical protein